MMILTNEQLNNHTKEALVIIIPSLQNQTTSMRKQLDTANASEPEIAEVIIASYRRKKSPMKRDEEL